MGTGKQAGKQQDDSNTILHSNCRACRCPETHEAQELELAVLAVVAHLALVGTDELLDQILSALALWHQDLQ